MAVPVYRTILNQVLNHELGILGAGVLLKEARDRDSLRQGKLLADHLIIISRETSDSSRAKGYRGQERLRHSHGQVVTEREAGLSLPKEKDAK